MALQVTAIMIGVEDLARSKAYYADGLGCTIEQDYPGFVRLGLGEGSSSLALYPRDAAAQTRASRPRAPGSAGLVPPHRVVERRGGRGDDGGREGRRRRREGGGRGGLGYFGYFSDPDGYLWKVATGS